MANAPESAPDAGRSHSPILKRLWNKIVDQWVIGSVLTATLAAIVLAYGVLRDNVESKLSHLIEAAVVADIKDQNTELHKNLSNLITNTVRGTVGASTKQFFELSADQNVVYVPVYAPKDHELLIYIDFLPVRNFPMPTKVSFSLEGISNQFLTDEPRSYSLEKVLKRVRQQREETATNAFVGSDAMVGILGKIAPNVFTGQFELRTEDLDKKIFMKLIVLVINPIWVENEPKN